MVVKKTGITVLGWLLVGLGVAALILPGPGLLLLLAGFVVLSQEYEWAAKRVEPVKEKALGVASESVSSYPRIASSALGAMAVIAVGAVWTVDPKIPVVGPFGPRLPLGGWPTGSGIVLSGLVALGLLAYSIVRFRRASGASAAPSAAQVDREASP